MSRPVRRISVALVALVAVIAIAACGQQKVGVTASSSVNSAVAAQDTSMGNLFHERCAGCHTLSYAAADGSGNNPRTYLDISGPNFNVRCERPVARVLYAIENGGFGGAYMPANIVVGAKARQLALFVSEFAGRQAPSEPGATPCQQQSIGSLPTTLTGGTNLPHTTTTSSSGIAGAKPTGSTASNTSGSTGNSGSASTGNSGASTSGKSIFVQNCGGCHVLADAGTAGNEGPNLDTLKPSESTVQHQVINGGGAMPAFGKSGLLTSAQITAVAKYVSSVAGKK